MYTKMEKRNTLKQEYYKTTFNSYWKDSEGKPTIEYVNWLEDKILQDKVNITLGSVSKETLEEQKKIAYDKGFYDGCDHAAPSF